MDKINSVLHHYLGICLVLVFAYFFVLSPILKHLEDTIHGTGPVVVSTQPTPANSATRSVGNLAQAATDKAITAALAGQVIQLSAQQQTIANAVYSIDHRLNTKLINAGVEGLTRPAPTVETISVGTKSRLVPPSPGPDDSQIQADMKKVLAESTIKTDTSVNVHWEDKPVSPIFAAYDSDGSAGVGYTVSKQRGFNIDGLFLVNQSSMELGAGLEHPIKGTAAGFGVSGGVDLRTHQPKLGVFVSVHN